MASVFAAEEADVEWREVPSISILQNEVRSISSDEGIFAGSTNNEKEIDQRAIISSVMVKRMDKLERRMDEIEANQWIIQSQNDQKKSETSKIANDGYRFSNLKFSSNNGNSKFGKDQYVIGIKEKRIHGIKQICGRAHKMSKCRVMLFRGRKMKFCTYRMSSPCRGVDKSLLKLSL